MSKPVQPDPLLLASASPRRVQLLREAGYAFRIAAPSISEPEAAHPHVSPPEYAESLAWFKACSVAPDHTGDAILAADTIAVVDGRIIGKPADRADARRIIECLSGTSHQVITGIALYQPGSQRRMLQHDVSRVRVRRLSGEEIEAYLRTDKWHGKAGAYGIQEEGDAFVEEVEGSFTNVVGLPMELLARLFETWSKA